MIEVLDVIKLIDAKTFQPKIAVKLEMYLEPIMDSSIVNDDDKVYAALGREITNKIKLLPPKRVRGTAIFKITNPIDTVRYLTTSGATHELTISSRTQKLDSLDELGEGFVQTAGENADIFLLSLSSEIVVDPTTLIRDYIYMVRFAYITEEYRKENNLSFCVSHDSAQRTW